MQELMDETDILISVESTTEWQINDILYDGQERYLQPLKFSDHVAKLSHKVKWHGLCGADEANSLRVKESQESEEIKKDTEDSKDELNKKDDRPEVTGKWDSVAKELTTALNELNVLRDVIKLLQTRQYMMLDRVSPSSEEIPTLINQRTLALTSKKKSLQQAQSVLGSVLEKLKAERSEAQNVNHVGSFQMELMRMRKRWRLKRSGNATLGDVAFRTAGSRFRPEATFEVEKCITEQEGGPPGITCPIKIVLPKDLEKNVGMKVTVRQDNQTVSSFVPNLKLISPGPADSSVKSRGWEDRLIRAQRTLLHRDIFVLLQREASMNESILCSVKSSTMSIQISPNAVLKLELVELEMDSETEQAVNSNPSTTGSSSSGNVPESTPNGDSFKPPNDPPSAASPPPSFSNIAFCVYDTIMHLYCKFFSGAPPPVPNLGLCRPYSAPSALFNQRKRLRLAGPNGTPLGALTQPTAPRVDASLLLLQRIVHLTKHILLVRSVQRGIDDFITGLRDVFVYCRWLRDPGVSSVQTTGMVYVSNPGCESFHASRLLGFNGSYISIEVGVDSIQLLAREGEVVQLGQDVQTVIHMLAGIITNNQMTTLQSVAKYLDWMVQSSQLQNALPDGTLCPVLLIGHPNGKRSISIKYPVGRQPEVKVQMESCPTAPAGGDAHGEGEPGDCIVSDLLDDNPHSETHRADFRPVVVEDLFGSTFLQKMEYLIVSLT